MPAQEREAKKNEDGWCSDGWREQNEPPAQFALDSDIITEGDLSKFEKAAKKANKSINKRFDNIYLLTNNLNSNKNSNSNNSNERAGSNNNNSNKEEISEDDSISIHSDYDPTREIMEIESDLLAEVSKDPEWNPAEIKNNNNNNSNERTQKIKKNYEQEVFYAQPRDLGHNTVYTEHYPRWVKVNDNASGDDCMVKTKKKYKPKNKTKNKNASETESESESETNINNNNNLNEPESESSNEIDLNTVDNKLKKYKSISKRKRHLNKKNKSRNADGTRIMFYLISGYGWKDKYIRFIAYLRRDRRSAAAAPKYTIKPVKYVNSYHTRDTMMLQIRNTPKLLDKRFTFDGARTHTSAGKSRDTKTERLTMNMLDYYQQSGIKTYGFAGKNVPSEYKSDVGWGAHSFDMQANEKAINLVKVYGKKLYSSLKKEDRTLINFMRCYQRGWEMVSQEVIDKFWINCWKNIEECIEANGDYGASYLRKKT